MKCLGKCRLMLELRRIFEFSEVYRYFRDKEILKQEDINAIVGLKNGAHPANMCYCFGWTKKRIKEDIKQNGKSKVLVDIKSNMNTIGCSCEIKNPSGNCCMADISKFLKELSYKN